MRCYLCSVACRTHGSALLQGAWSWLLCLFIATPRQFVFQPPMTTQLLLGCCKRLQGNQQEIAFYQLPML